MRIKPLPNYAHTTIDRAASQQCSPSIRLLRWIYLRHGFSKVFAFSAGILLRAPVLSGLQFVALRLASGPPILKAVGALIVGLLGATAAREEVKEREIFITAPPIPTHWNLQDASDVRMRRVRVESEQLGTSGTIQSYLEQVIHETSHDRCVGRDGIGATKRARVIRVERIENMRLWKAYWHRKQEMQDAHKANGVSAVVQLKMPPRLSPGSPLDRDCLLEAELNETFLFHGAYTQTVTLSLISLALLSSGTSCEVADIVAEHGFDERVASMSGLYGAGVYTIPMPFCVSLYDCLCACFCLLQLFSLHTALRPYLTVYHQMCVFSSLNQVCTTPPKHAKLHNTLKSNRTRET